MKRTVPFLFLLTGLAVVSGYLLSKASLVGRTGINLFYKEYRFLKTRYKGGAVVLLVWLLLFFGHRQVQRRWAPAKAKWLHVAGLILAMVGLYFTYADFRNDLSHRLLGERFHLGAYLFWVGWMLICLFFLWPQKRTTIAEQNRPLSEEGI